MTRCNSYISASKGWIFNAVITIACCSSLHAEHPQKDLLNQETTYQEVKEKNDAYSQLEIKKIIVSGNDHIKKEVILNRLPYKVGHKLDANKRAQAIKNIYSLGYFKQVRLEGEKIDAKSVILHVIVEEKYLLERLDFSGNKRYRTRKLKEKLNLTKLATIDEETVQRIEQGVKNAYKEEGRYLVKVTGTITPNKDNPKKASAHFTVKEGPKSSVSRVYFKGNVHVPERKIRNAIFSQENWLLSFMNNAGVYQDDMVDVDKHRIEALYRDHGFLMAKVYKTQVDFVNKSKDIAITFHIKENQQFFVREIHVIGDELVNEKELLPMVKLEKGKPFSQSKLTSTINIFKNLWGEKGYIYADVYPQVTPDEKTNQVDITFHIERGNKLYVNRINVTGNNITRDKIIRRKLEIIEGDLITSKNLEQSKSNVEYLSFFDREGVSWKVHRITDDLADLEMNVKETKTGSLNFMLTYGSEPNFPTPSLKGSVMVEKANLLGLGYDIGGSLQASRHRLQKVEAHFLDPSVFDSNLSCVVNGYKRWEDYEFWRNVNKTPVQKVLGANVGLGLSLPNIDNHLQILFDFGIEDIRNNKPHATHNPEIFQPIVTRTFQSGTLKWCGIDVIKDTRNHQAYPNKGFRIALNTKMAPPLINHQFSLCKAELEASNYTALIGEDWLVLALRAKAGRISTMSHKTVVPYKELFHMGGQSTVRGFIWGGVGPAWGKGGDPLGARNAVLFSAELIFPIIADYSMKGHVFYDAGAGWDTPKGDLSKKQKSYIVRDKFDLRHSVGIGLNLLKPMPAKIDWGFKIDRKPGESPQEFHLGMNYAF